MQVGPDVDDRGVEHAATKHAALSKIAEMYATKGKAEDSFRIANLIEGRLKVRTWLLLAGKFASDSNFELAERALAQVVGDYETPIDLRQTVFIFSNAAGDIPTTRAGREVPTITPHGS